MFWFGCLVFYWGHFHDLWLVSLDDDWGTHLDGHLDTFFHPKRLSNKSGQDLFENLDYLDNSLVSVLLCQGLRPQAQPLRVQIQELAREQSGDTEAEPGHGGCQQGREILKTLLVDINTRRVALNCEIKYHIIL